MTLLVVGLFFSFGSLANVANVVVVVVVADVVVGSINSVSINDLALTIQFSIQSTSYTLTLSYPPHAHKPNTSNPHPSIMIFTSFVAIVVGLDGLA